ncbi:hypothetical protein SKAU_G00374120 [Synaphobranchus kaupii]|uniref:Uncharacterized protein n=1 Tax=Synaphobranchus kaupii TaxID=118154 RepID=A0A9Q1IG93_SYNKA|nr:hypothetical protein SKAU_G00374120 [Synaphobranchus kaupii]
MGAVLGNEGLFGPVRSGLARLRVRHPLLRLRGPREGPGACGLVGWLIHATLGVRSHRKMPRTEREERMNRSKGPASSGSTEPSLMSVLGGAAGRAKRSCRKELALGRRNEREEGHEWGRAAPCVLSFPGVSSCPTGGAPCSCPQRHQVAGLFKGQP